MLNRPITYQSLTGELSDDEPYDEIYDDCPNNQPQEDNIDNSPTGSQQTVSSSASRLC